MTNQRSWIFFKVLFLASFACAGMLHAGDWSDPVEVRHQTQLCVAYRAKLSGEFLVVEANHEPGWHTYAVDNRQRAKEKLAGKRSLGIDAPTEIKCLEGLELAGPWFQSLPKDLSKPELRWFSWGFEGQSLFVAKAKRLGSGPVRIAIRGQACSDTTCKNVDLEIMLRLTASAKAEPPIDFKTLIQSR